MNFYALSRRAWAIRRSVAAQVGLPVMSVSWKGCLLLADSEESAAGLALLPAPRCAPVSDRWRAIASTGWPPSPVPVRVRRSGVRRAVGVAASAALAVALVLIIV